MKKTKQKILIFFFFLFFIILIFSAIKIIKWYQDGQAVNKMIATLSENITKEEKKEDGNTLEFCNKRCINSNFLEVDIKKLKAENEEVVGWIQIPKTNVDYPFVKHKNNSYYLNHSFDKKYNEAGWVFADYRNNFDNLDQNTIIYAHGRVDGTMFGTLKNLLDENVFQKEEEKIVKVSTENYNYIFEIFSIYHIKTTDDYTYTNFDQKDYKEFLQKVKNRSSYDLDVNVLETDRILTLSTCYNVEEKVVLHARLAKIQKRK